MSGRKWFTVGLLGAIAASALAARTLDDLNMVKITVTIKSSDDGREMHTTEMAYHLLESMPNLLLLAASLNPAAVTIVGALYGGQTTTLQGALNELSGAYMSAHLNEPPQARTGHEPPPLASTAHPVPILWLA